MQGKLRSFDRLKKTLRHARAGFSYLELQVALLVFGVAITGLGPMVMMQAKQLDKLEDRFSDDFQYHLAAPANSWAGKLGAAALIQETEPAAASNFQFVYLNFQKVGFGTPGTFEGHTYVRDQGYKFNSRNGHKYGWTFRIDEKHTKYRKKGDSPDDRYPTLIETWHIVDNEWDLEVPEDIYQVRIVVGDSDHHDSVYRFNVEGKLAIAGTPTVSNLWFERTVTVLVTDGKLTISSADGSDRNKICFVDIVRGVAANEVRIESIDKSITSEEVTAEVSVEPLP